MEDFGKQRSRKWQVNASFSAAPDGPSSLFEYHLHRALLDECLRRMYPDLAPDAGDQLRVVEDPTFGTVHIAGLEAVVEAPAAPPDAAAASNATPTDLNGPAAAGAPDDAAAG
ncbi:hypothetical protein AAIH25_16260, partial [Arthrobacter crystallopoietes]|uniref:hypothetical protein n=1 Tax=Crystallibacter crystallopoietes TaxID=37928 RepID=UPI003D19E88A